MTFSFIYIYFIAVYSKFTCSDYELCLPTNYNGRRIWRETRSILQLLLGPKSVESVPSGKGAMPAQGCRFWFMARYTRDVFMPREIQHSFFKECRISELTTRIRKNICESGYVLFFQVYPEISALQMNQMEVIQWEAVCTMDWLETWIQGESFWIKRIAPRPSNSNKDRCNFYCWFPTTNRLCDCTLHVCMSNCGFVPWIFKHIVHF